jgi:hypothetical protein
MTQPTHVLVIKKVINMDETNKHYAALTIDTSIFERNGLKLNKGLLAQLHQFKDNPINLVLSDIVYWELKSHLNKKEKDTRNKIELALNNASDYLNCCTDDMEKIKSLIKIDYEIGTISNSTLEDFIRKCGIELVKSEEYCDIKSLIDMYFLHHAPFKESGNKKNEFPDAIALLSLQAWAENNNKNLLAVSLDNDWENFSQHKHNIDIVDDLAKAMEILNRQTEALDSIIREIQLDLLENKSNGIFQNIYTAIKDSISISEIHADSVLNYSIDSIDTYLEKIDILKEEDERQLKVYVVDSNSDTITISIACKVFCNVEATFNFSLGVSGEYVSIGSTTRAIETSYATNVLVHLHGNYLDGLQNMEINDIEVTGNLREVDMGELFPFDPEEYYE